MDQIRSCFWLEAVLRNIWDRHFADVPVANSVGITYCQASKTRLGWIALSESGRYTSVGINRLLRFPEAPEAVCVITIAHELVHYAHGFGSPLLQRYRDPHAGGIVERELVQRGLGRVLDTHQYWSQHSWNAHYARFARLRSRAFDGLGASDNGTKSASQYPTIAALDVALTPVSPYSEAAMGST